MKESSMWVGAAGKVKMGCKEFIEILQSEGGTLSTAVKKIKRVENKGQHNVGRQRRRQIRFFWFSITSSSRVAEC